MKLQNHNSEKENISVISGPLKKIIKSKNKPTQRKVTIKLET
jgi:hypothetical protein